MDELLTINDRYTYAQDEQGAYGSLVQPESELAVPEADPVNSPDTPGTN